MQNSFVVAGLALVAFSMGSCGRDEFRSGFSSGQDGFSLGRSVLPGEMDFQGALDSISEQTIKDQLYLLAGTEFAGRGSGAEGGRKAREWIAKRFAEIGLTPAVEGDWFQYFTTSGVSGKTANVLGYLPGNDPALKDQVVVVGAHHDHLGTKNGAIYFGADDNASGTDAVVEVAAAMAKLRDGLRRTVLFATFDAEEKGLVGSYAYTSKPVFALDKTVYMLNLDMIGYLKQKKNIQCLGCKSSTYAAKVLSGVMSKYPTMGTPNMTSSASAGSDHYPFREKGVPYAFFHTGTDVSPYHQPTDTPDKIDYRGVTDATKVAFEAAWTFATEDQSPRDSAKFDSNDEFDGLDHGVLAFER